MRKIIVLMLVFIGSSALWAQAAKNTLYIRGFSGGQGNDAAGFTAAFKNQEIIQSCFALVDDPLQAVYAMDGVIRREGIGYIADFSITRLKDKKELGKESISYRAFLEAGAYIPTVAANLTRVLNPRIAIDDELVPLPNIDAIASAPLGLVLVADVIPEPHVSAPAPLPVMQETAANPSAQDARKPKPEPKPSRTKVDKPEKDTQAAEARKLEVAEWRKNLFYLGFWAGFSNTGSLDFIIEADLRPFIDVSWFGVKLGGGVANGMGAKEDIVITNFNKTSGSTSSSEPLTYPLLYLAPKLKFRIGNTDLGLFIGPALSILSTNLETFDSLGQPLDNAKFYNICLGPIFGTELDVKLGPGCLFFALNGGILVNTVSPNITNVSNVRYDSLQDITYLNIGIGYRFGFIKKQ